MELVALEDNTLVGHDETTLVANDVTDEVKIANAHAKNLGATWTLPLNSEWWKRDQKADAPPAKDESKKGKGKGKGKGNGKGRDW